MAAGSDVVVIFRVAIATAMLRPALWVLGVGVCESVTVTVKLAVLAEVPVGVPEIEPALLKVKPAGKLPAVTLHV